MMHWFHIIIKEVTYYQLQWHYHYVKHSQIYSLYKIWFLKIKLDTPLSVQNFPYIPSTKIFKDLLLTLDIAETPSNAYTTFDTSPSPLWDMTWIAMASNDPSEIQVRDSNSEVRPTSKKPARLSKSIKSILHHLGIIMIKP